MIYNNLDKTDAQLNTCAPFTFECSMNIGGIAIPSCGFLSVKLFLSRDNSMPARLSSLALEKDATILRVSFSDGKDNKIGSVAISSSMTSDTYISGCIHDDIDTAVGHVTMTKETAELLFAAASLNNGSIATDENDFILLPQCCGYIEQPECRYVGINGEYDKSSIVLKLDTNMYLTYDPTASPRVHYISVRDEPSEPPVFTKDTYGNNAWFSSNGLKCIKVERKRYYLDPEDPEADPLLRTDSKTLGCDGLDLIVKHSKDSNIRISTINSDGTADKEAVEKGITIAGVYDESVVKH